MRLREESFIIGFQCNISTDQSEKNIASKDISRTWRAQKTNCKLFHLMVNENENSP